MDKFITKAGAAMTAKLPFEQQVHAFAANGLDHPDWKNQMQSGYNNLASIRLDAKGKPIGELNEQGKSAIDLFRRMDAVNADYAKGLIGAEVYQRFSDIGFLMHLGKTSSEAASIAANAASGAVLGSDTEKLMKKVKSEVGKLLADPWYSADWVRHLGGDNTHANTAQVHGWMRRYGTLLVQSGMYGDSDTALRAASEYLADPKVSAKVNGTLYMRSEMPTAPSSRSQDEWFSRFIDAVPKARAKELHSSGNEVRLEFDENLMAYRPFIKGIPLHDTEGNIEVYTKAEIQAWYAEEEKRDISAAVANANTMQADKAHDAYRKRIWSEVGQVQRDEGRFAMERYDGTVNKSVLESRIFGRDAFAQITKDGNAGKSLGELMKLYPARRRVNP
ncbi:hypothetical protein [Variovorax sp. KK3]|uniref:hypothetical protein n=1 Tax=Variovorax sp. KK3 TaxID=1855728 RepID=UPI00117F267E|nr:hypothetical protein [Variovorax sp. KK3]